MSTIPGFEFRITQVLLIAIGMTVVWIFNYIKQPETEIHRVNFGNYAQLVSVVPAPENILRGRNVEFSIRWWLLKPLPKNYIIGYRVRNGQKDIALLDTSNIQISGQAYTDIPTNGLLFNDKISLPIPLNTQPGIYEVVAYIYPFEGYALSKSLGSPIFSPQRTLFTLNITR
ncbi:MAG: hypothetical protein Q7T48_15380 [Cellvibrio sp.]|uniref:hypothetical protein n=1 Tax=Cellvibrio sp. TaxID=1965322 RepID=UPI0027237ACC|nr:hypothetical protein [Cellvibrio sp.]